MAVRDGTAEFEQIIEQTTAAIRDKAIEWRELAGERCFLCGLIARTCIIDSVLLSHFEWRTNLVTENQTYHYNYNIAFSDRSWIYFRIGR